MISRGGYQVVILASVLYNDTHLLGNTIIDASLSLLIRLSKLIMAWEHRDPGGSKQSSFEGEEIGSWIHIHDERQVR